ncbi:MAG: hypothetical protein A3E85_04145 [Gammaproteobacteria bacterium RIFCSPHIGHO2_12_FULL_45_12]|nr:MAG: hypothetical protein A3E85_04145 [Gammaproteobacteria bacterium RIFCSPHIGHO2_12_FULL_45_12]
MKIVKKLILGMLNFFLLMLLLVMLFVVMASTPSGTRAVLSLAHSLAPNAFQYQAVTGRLTSALTLYDLEVTTPSVDIKAGQVKFVWQPLALWRGKWQINQLLIQQMKVVFKMNQAAAISPPLRLMTETEVLRLSHWTKYLDLQQLECNQVRVMAEDKLVINLASLHLHELPSHAYQIDMHSSLGNMTGRFFPQWTDELNWVLQLKSDSVQLVPTMQSMVGPMSFVIHAKGKFGQQAELTLRVKPFQGTWRQQAVKGDLWLVYQAARLKKLTLSLTLADAVAHVQGDMTQALNFNWRISVPQLVKLWPSWSGDFLSDGNLSGTLARPVMAARIHSSKLLMEGVSVDKLHALIKARMDGATLKSVEANIHAQLFIAKLGVTLKKINLEVSQVLGKPWQLNGAFSSGLGRATLAGELNWHQRAMSAALTLKGHDLQVVNLKEYAVTLSPNVTLRYVHDVIQVQGVLRVPSASIKPLDFSTMTTLPEDVVIAQAKPTDEARLFNRLILNLQVVLGDHILMDYQNVSAQLKGKLIVDKRAGGALTGVGELRTENGKYAAYGRKLTIERGRLIYAGNVLTNPGLDIKATQLVKVLSASGGSQLTNAADFQSGFSGTETVLVGLAVSGTLNHPRVSFFSVPEGISRMDIISYLIFGYPQSQVSSASGLLLLNNVFNHPDEPSSISKVTQGLQNSLGLSELGMENVEYFDANTNTTGSAQALSLGKELGHDISLHYSVGVMQSVSVLNIRYQWRKHWVLQAETNALENGVDVLYSIER